MANFRTFAAGGVGLMLLGLAVVLFRDPRVEVVGTLSRADVVEICRVVSRAEISMEQPQVWREFRRFSWQGIRVLPTYLRFRLGNRIVSITKDREGSVRVDSISGLWGQRLLRLEKRDGRWLFMGKIQRDPQMIVL